MVNNIVEYTNDVIQPALERFSDDALDASTKYTHFCIVDHMNIQAALGILYLRAALRINPMSLAEWALEKKFTILDTMKLPRGEKRDACVIH